MPFLTIAVALLLVALIGLLVYWQVFVAEGAYLGQGVVTILYDLFASRYDGVKQFDADHDALMLALPILQYLNGQLRTTGDVLDVATGTGRLPVALFAQVVFKGSVIATDLSERMLAVARKNLSDVPASRLAIRVMDAQRLRFPDCRFDVVTCLEALEFMPKFHMAIMEMIRVLRPGGLLMLTNRVGEDAWKLPGRTQTTEKLVALLTEMGLASVEHEHWMTDYDLVIARKTV